MEKGLNALIKERFGMKDRDVRSYSPLTLAFIGDCIFDLVVRSLVVDRGNAPVNRLNYRADCVVKASSQAKMLRAIWPALSEEEQDYYRRGRNAKPHSIAKNATVSDYHDATGLECLMGYLYLTDQTERVLDLMKAGMEACDFLTGGKAGR